MGVQSHSLYRETFFPGQAPAHERVDRRRHRMAIDAVDVVCTGGATAPADAELSDDHPPIVEGAASGRADTGLFIRTAEIGRRTSSWNAATLIRPTHSTS